MIFVCPTCKSDLVREESALRCDRCAKSYPIDADIADFAEGQYYDVFTGTEELTPEHRAGLALEEAGARWRIEHYYAPRLTDRGRVLDCGCGNGLSVESLLALGHDAWGIDLSALRKWQWRDRTHRDRLAVASALSLPFATGAFDAVLSSGVIEHIGVRELGGATYSVTPLPERDALRRVFVAELLRVTRPGGRVYIDCPNGFFPIDFWHSKVGGRGRWHSTDEGFLPTLPEIRRLVGSVQPRATVSLHTARGRFAFRQVSRHWYGRLLRGPAAGFIRLLDAPPFRRLAPWLTPYLVVEVATAT